MSLITHLRTAIFASVAKSTEEKYHLLKTEKLVLLYEYAAKLVSFEWSHPKIFSTHSKGRCVFESVGITPNLKLKVLSRLVGLTIVQSSKFPKKP